MPYKVIELVIDGVDLNNAPTGQRVSEHLSDMSWGSSNGIATVSTLGDFKDTVSTALTMRRRIQHQLPHARIVRVFEDFVTTAEIALRAGVSREAVRLWAKAERGSVKFPAFHQIVGAGKNPSPIWKWAHVSAWLDAHGGLGDGVIYPSDAEIAEINAHLSGVLTGPHAASFEQAGLPRALNWTQEAISPTRHPVTAHVRSQQTPRGARTRHYSRETASTGSR